MQSARGLCITSGYQIVRENRSMCNLFPSPDLKSPPAAYSSDGCFLLSRQLLHVILSSLSNLLIRITVGGKRAEISIQSRRIGGIQARVVCVAPKKLFRKVNSMIENSMLHIIKIHNILSDENEVITPEKIKSIFVGSDCRKMGDYRSISIS